MVRLIRPVNTIIAKSSKKRVRRYHRRQHALLITAIIFLLLAAFVLQLLVALSLPVVKRVYLMTLRSTAAQYTLSAVATEIRFGVWGYCALSDLSIDDGQCTKPKLGYNVSETILDLTGNPDLVKLLLQGLTIVLVLHPVAAGVIFISFLCTLFSFSHIFSVCALIWTVVAAILATISTAVDLGLVAYAMKKVKDVSEFSFEIKWGNAQWMSLTAAVLLWIVIIVQSAALCGCCWVSRRLWTRVDEQPEDKSSNDPTPQVTPNEATKRAQL